MNTNELDSTEFYASELINALQAEGLPTIVYQSGGNTATFELRLSEKYPAFSIGPGSYNWSAPLQSVFTTDELYYGFDYNEYVEAHGNNEPESFDIKSGTSVPDAAKEIAGAYRKAIDHGFVSLGKYSSARDSILHYMAGAGWGNASSGDVEAPTGWFARVSNSWEECKPEALDFTSMLEEWFETNPEVIDSPQLRADLVGHFMVSEDSNGFVSVAEYPSAHELEQAYESLEGIYGEWLGQDEED